MKSDPWITYGEHIQVTPEEDAAVQRHFQFLKLVMGDGEQEGDVVVRQDLYPWFIAQGLWHYAEELVRFEPAPTEGGDRETFEKAAQAVLKALKLAPAPMFMYQSGILLDALESPEAHPMLDRFLRLRGRIPLSDEQRQLLSVLAWDEEAAVRDAERRLARR